MERYRSYGELDDTPLNDGDNFFTGFRSRVQPSFLDKGQLSYSQNGRMDRGTWRMRKGCSPRNSGVGITYSPLIVDSFSIVSGVVIKNITNSSGLWIIETDTPHGFSTFQYVDISGIVTPGFNGTAIVTVIDSTHFSFYGNGLTLPPAYTYYPNALATGGPVLYDEFPVITACSFSDPITYNEGIVIAGLNSAYLYSYTGGTSILNYQYGESCDATQSIDLFQYLGNIYLLRGYGQLESISVTGGDSLTMGYADINLGLTNLDFIVGDWFSLFEATGGFNGIYRIEAITKVGSYYFATVKLNGYDSIVVPSFTAKLRRAKPPLVWNMDTSVPVFRPVSVGNNIAGANFIKMPASNWGTHYKSRVVLALNKDEIVLSDILDPDTYDLSYYQFRILPGSADWLVSAIPFQEDKILVLYRNSVHVLFLDNNTLSITQAAEITRAFGCVARKTVINCGQYILWLSDAGVMRMNVTDFITLKNDTKPLSDDIQDIIDRVNWSYADKAVAKYWDNRAYFALPIDGSTVNNTVIVYNFLNGAWESRDVYPTGVSISSFEATNYAGKRRLHAVTTTGYILLLDELDGSDEVGYDPQTSTVVTPIDAHMITRSYLSGTYDVKNVKRAQIEVSGDNGGVVTTSAILHNPDYTTSGASFTRTIGNPDVSLRNTINKRGNAVQMKVVTTGKSSDIKTVVVESRVVARTTINRE